MWKQMSSGTTAWPSTAPDGMSPRRDTEGAAAMAQKGAAERETRSTATAEERKHDDYVQSVTAQRKRGGRGGRRFEYSEQRWSETVAANKQYGAPRWLRLSLCGACCRGTTERLLQCTLAVPQARCSELARDTSADVREPWRRPARVVLLRWCRVVPACVLRCVATAAHRTDGSSCCSLGTIEPRWGLTA